MSSIDQLIRDIVQPAIDDALEAAVKQLRAELAAGLAAPVPLAPEDEAVIKGLLADVAALKKGAA